MPACRLSKQQYLRSVASDRTATGLAVAALVTLAACGSGGGGSPDAAPVADATPAVDAAVAPALRNPVDLPDAELALQALQLMGAQVAGSSKNCNSCHGLTRQKLRQWRAFSDQSMSTCLTDLSVGSTESALQMINCLREDPTDETSTFQADKLGIYASASHLAWFEFVFWRAFGETGGETARDEWGRFINRIGMPKGGHAPYTQPELDIVAEWFARGLPEIDTTLPDDPPPDECTPGISTDVATHVSAMKLMGWGAVNAENNILMHGCGGVSDPLDCLTAYPRTNVESYAAGWESLAGAKLRLLTTVNHVTSFWTRSSADGRFVAHGAKELGARHDSAIIDLGENARVIPTTAYYDPAFFPDNSGFVFQGWRAFMCTQSVLTGSPADIDYGEAQCSRTRRIGLYEHVGAALGGGDYWAVDGQFENDNNGFEPTFSDPDTSFSSQAEISLTPMVHDGSNYTAGSSVNVASPFEGDVVLSPSARLVVTRLAGPGDKQLGYVLRRVDATPTADSYTIDLPEVARYCINGSKPSFSFDERWMVVHHYIDDDDATDLGYTGADDVGFAEYKTQGAANVYLIDVLSGKVTRVTKMNPGQYALFPHFRSDGWIYFVVRTVGSTEEHIVASDAALVVEAGE